MVGSPTKLEMAPQGFCRGGKGRLGSPVWGLLEPLPALSPAQALKDGQSLRKSVLFISKAACGCSSTAARWVSMGVVVVCRKFSHAMLLKVTVWQWQGQDERSHILPAWHPVL